ncbi:hypothetical protein [Saccharospirillum alexandrii]|uniref:hypothetical protein n=1 Tax=Saccharospirillum alexandrii TaxID=2448477 RepID=UPI000FD79A44|nr:hypothetical protein [Saccharospirillum alexandrii]
MNYNRLNPIIGYRSCSKSFVSVVYGFQQLELFARLPEKANISVPYVEIMEPARIWNFIEMELLRISLSQVSSKSYGAMLNSYLSYVLNHATTENNSFYKKINFAEFAGIDRRKVSPSVDKAVFSYK